VQGPTHVLLDVDGVLAISWEPVPGAPRAVNELRAQGRVVAFVTNTTSTPRREIVERLASCGIRAFPEEVFTAPRAAASYLHRVHPGRPCLLLSQGDIGEDLPGVRLSEEQAEVVLTGGAGPAITYASLNRAFCLLRAGAPLVAMHRNLEWATREGMQLDMGAFVIGLEAAAATTATVVGKPSRAFYAAVLAELGVAPGDAVMVGDDLDADVGGAQQAGISGLLVMTGKFRPSVLEHATTVPDAVLASVADLPSLLERGGGGGDHRDGRPRPRSDEG
jgi:HAD superfamily hydrolase (TIGR01458 family)